MLRATYDWTMRLSASPHAVWMLAAIAFIESSFFPIPVGGYFGYLIGYALFDTIGQPIIAFYGFEHTFESFTARYNEFGAWIVFTFGVTPFPYKVVTIASGVTQLDPAV